MSRVVDIAFEFMSRSQRDSRLYLSLFLCRNHRWGYGHFPNLLSPKSFTEKLLKKMALDRRSVLVTIADRLKARTYISERMGCSDLLVDIAAVIRDPDEIYNVSLPERFIMKANHASGWSKIYSGSKEPDREELHKLASKWLALEFGKSIGEWVYGKIEKAILIEPLMLVDGSIPNDYKFFCFDGVPTFIQVDSDRFGEHKRDYFDPDWKLLEVVVTYPRSEQPPAKPTSLEQMLAIASTLSRGLDFVRVDLYDINGAIKVGEFTNYPGGAREKFQPQSFDIIFGEHWRSPSILTLLSAK